MLRGAAVVLFGGGGKEEFLTLVLSPVD